MRALTWLTTANSILYLAASISHGSVGISLGGPLTLGFPASSASETIAEGLIGVVLAVAALTLFRGSSMLIAWGAYVFALGGSLLGLSIARGIGGPDLGLHLLMLAGLAGGFVLLVRASGESRST
jgi:hypothetical protein